MEGGVIALILLGMMFAGVALWGITDSILSHRREMAQIKFGQSEREAELSAENAELVETVEHMKDRLAVLETIATDPAKRTADEIEKLR